MHAVIKVASSNTFIEVISDHAGKGYHAAAVTAVSIILVCAID
jgi:hypothetical protein